MLVLDCKQFFQSMTQAKTTVVWFYNGHGSLKSDGTNLPHVRPMTRIVCQTEEACMQEVVKFSETYPAKFSAYLHTSDSAITKNGNFVLVDFSKVVIVGNTSTVNVAPLNEAEMIKQITAKLQKEADKKITEKKLEAAESKLELQDQSAERLAMIGVKMLAIFSGAVPSQAMQGTGEEEGGGTGSTDSEGAMDIQAAVDYLRRSIGDDNLIILAEKIKADKTGKVLNMIKMYL